jgi:hypothetical protein
MMRVVRMGERCLGRGERMLMGKAPMGMGPQLITSLRGTQ